MTTYLYLFSSGVSNFSVEYLERLLKVARVVPAVNQIELHPYEIYRSNNCLYLIPVQLLPSERCRRVLPRERNCHHFLFALGV